MASQTGKQVTAIHILPKNLRNKGIQPMKLGQSNVRNFLLMQKMRQTAQFQSFIGGGSNWSATQF